MDRAFPWLCNGIFGHILKGTLICIGTLIQQPLLMRINVLPKSTTLMTFMNIATTK